MNLVAMFLGMANAAVNKDTTLYLLINAKLLVTSLCLIHFSAAVRRWSREQP
jgi:hypothetical protein